MTRSAGSVHGRLLLPSITILALLLFLPGCGSRGTQAVSGLPPGTGSVAFTVEWEKPPPVFLAAAAGGSAFPMAPVIDVCADYGVDTVTVKVLSGTDTLASGGFPCAQHQGVLNNVPAGDNLVLRIEGDVPGAGTVFAGDSAFSLAAGESKSVGPVLMSYVGSDTTAPFVVSRIPDNNAVDVEYEPTLTVRFSERMALNTVLDNDAFVVLDNTGTPVGGTISYSASDNTARFVPLSALASGAVHTVTLSPTITDMTQNPLAGTPYQWGFTVHEQGTWASPVTISADPNYGAYGTIQDDHVAVVGDGSGNAFALWTQVNIFENNIREVWARKYSAAEKTWKTAVRISPATRNASSPEVTAGPEDAAVVVYSIENGGAVYRRYDPLTESWGSPEIFSDSPKPSSPGVAIDAAGTAFLIWLEPGEFGFIPPTICSRRHLPGIGLTPPRGLAACNTLSSGGTAVSNPRIVSDPSGNATAIWIEDDRIRARRFSATTAQWNPLDNVLSSPLRSLYPDISINPNGDLFAAWVEIAADNTSWQIVSRNFPAGAAGWSAAVPLASDSRDPGFPQDPVPRVAVDGSGNAFAVWHQNEEIFARRFDSGSWLAAEKISGPLGFWSYSKPEVAADLAGNAFVSWTTDSCPSSQVWGNRYSVADGIWAGAVLIRNTVCNTAVNVAATRNEDAFSIFWSTTIGGEGGLHTLYSSRNF